MLSLSIGQFDSGAKVRSVLLMCDEWLIYVGTVVNIARVLALEKPEFFLPVLDLLLRILIYLLLYFEDLPKSLFK